MKNAVAMFLYSLRNHFVTVYLWEIKAYFWGWRVMGVFDIRDFWVGVYFNTKNIGVMRQYSIYLCILPCLPILFRKLERIDNATSS